ncbi:SHOCT domain-containing protein [methane-oxidizing endosymbiont of Gigantopelta aegis]|nr:SHOCT domain-containing protein [methane-oxidizing endosymbiont of Gigantopelta aegis]
MAALTQLKKLFEADLISEDEYRAKKQDILNSL